MHGPVLAAEEDSQKADLVLGRLAKISHHLGPVLVELVLQQQQVINQLNVRLWL